MKLLTNHVVSFEQPGPGLFSVKQSCDIYVYAFTYWYTCNSWLNIYKAFIPVFFFFFFFLYTVYMLGHFLYSFFSSFWACFVKAGDVF